MIISLGRKFILIRSVVVVCGCNGREIQSTSKVNSDSKKISRPQILRIFIPHNPHIPQKAKKIHLARKFFTRYISVLHLSRKKKYKKVNNV